MAKSIFEILADLQTETSVPEIKKTVQHTIPRSLFPEPEIFDNAEKLLAWTEENNFTHALLQMGLQKGLIDLRARFKATKKDETWSETLGQRNIDSHKWETVTRGKAGDKVGNAVAALEKLTPEQLAEILAKLGK